MRWPRMTVRRLMIVVVAAGLVIGLGWPAIRASRDPAVHVHFLIERGEDSRWTYAMRFVREPFWTRYGLQLRGKSWKDQPSCCLDGSRGDEICGLDRPDCIHDDPVTGHVSVVPTVDMDRKFRTLKGEPPDPRLEARSRAGRGSEPAFRPDGSAF